MRNHKRKPRILNTASLASIKYGNDIFIGGVKYRGRMAEYKQVIETDKSTGVKTPVMKKIVSALPFVRID